MADETNRDAAGATQPARAIGRQDAGAKFGTARADSLRGSLTRRLPSPAPAATPEPDVAPNAPTEPAGETPHAAVPQDAADVDTAPTASSTSRPSSSTPRPRAERSAAKVAERTPQEGNQSKRNYSFRVPVTTMNLLREEREERHVRNDTVVFDAIDALVDAGADDPYAKLRTVVSEATTGLTTAPSLFERAGVKATSDDDSATTVQCLIRVTPHNQTVLDSLVAAVGALDRGHMINAALEHYFARR